jgi:hypothetical protein
MVLTACSSDSGGSSSGLSWEGEWRAPNRVGIKFKADVISIDEDQDLQNLNWQDIGTFRWIEGFKEFGRLIITTYNGERISHDVEINSPTNVSIDGDLIWGTFTKRSVQ